MTPVARQTVATADLGPFSRLTADVLLLIDATVGAGPLQNDAVRQALNGGFADGVRATLDLDARRTDGIFFTGASLRTALADMLSPGSSTLFVDPACGAGDLLIEAATRLPIGECVSETVSAWGRRLGGADIHADFVEAAKARLILLAVTRHRAELPGRSLQGVAVAQLMRTAFPYFRAMDGVQFLRAVRSEYSEPFDIIMNPPFSARPMSPSYRWADGSRTVAAAFLDEAIEHLPIGGRFAAILPDVIRSGSNHESLRRSLGCRLDEITVTTHGQFDRFADVDVFLLYGVKRATGPPPVRVEWWPEGDSALSRLGDRFDVRIGTVVDNRDPRIGRSLPYIRARDLPRREEAPEDFPIRSHEGRTFTGPFLLLRRTSRPVQGKMRLSPVIIEAGEHFVDNHLIVIRSRTGSLEELRGLARLLRSAQVTTWLNERIRCRHLTATAVKDVPLPDR